MQRTQTERREGEQREREREEMRREREREGEGERGPLEASLCSALLCSAHCPTTLTRAPPPPPGVLPFVRARARSKQDALEGQDTEAPATGDQ